LRIKQTINEQLTEIILAFILPILIIFMLNFQIFGVVNGFYVYLMLCIGEIGLAIIIINNDKKYEVKK